MVRKKLITVKGTDYIFEKKVIAFWASFLTPNLILFCLEGWYHPSSLYYLLEFIVAKFHIVGYKGLLLQQFVSLWSKFSKHNEYVCDVIHGIPIDLVTSRYFTCVSHLFYALYYYDSSKHTNL